jgi:Mannosyltransferase (PIG-V)
VSVGPSRLTAADARPLRPAGALARLRADPPRMRAVRAMWLALWSSRLAVWIAGIAAGVTLSSHAGAGAVNPRGLTRGLGRVGEVLAGPVARWDAGWFLLIARDGYQPQLGAHSQARLAFYPLYPLLTRIVGLVAPLVIAGVVVSVCAFAAALYGIHRLATLELARDDRLTREQVRRIADLSVLLVAFSPMAVFFSADYSESLFMALSVALFWCARRGRWRWVGVVGALASATRAPGIVLLLPALAIYLYGPREDRPPDRPRQGDPAVAPHAPASRLAALREGLRPRYRVRADVLWLALAPVGMLAFCTYVALAGGSFLEPFKVEHLVWHRHLTDPLSPLWYGISHAFQEVRHLPSTHRLHLRSFYFVAAGMIATAGVLRRLPLAYGLYALAALAMPLFYPASSEPLESMPRYLVVVFPLFIWLAMWLERHPRLRLPALAISGLMMMFFVASFSTWRWAS